MILSDWVCELKTPLISFKNSDEELSSSRTDDVSEIIDYSIEELNKAQKKIILKPLINVLMKKKDAKNLLIVMKEVFPEDTAELNELQTKIQLLINNDDREHEHGMDLPF